MLCIIIYVWHNNYTHRLVYTPATYTSHDDEEKLMAPTSMARAFAPGHVTGLFRIVDDASDPLLRGSVGAGFSVDIGTVTTIHLSTDGNGLIEVLYNGKIIDAPVTRTVVDKMLTEHDLRECVDVHVEHDSSLTIGVGYGASSAGALSTALALAAILDGPETDLLRAAQYAHYADVMNHTGLGDVIGATFGGLEIRTRAGAPGIGQLMKVDYPSELVVALAGGVGIWTKDILLDPVKRQLINEAGDSLVKWLIDHPDVDAFITASREFAKKSGLMTERVRSALNALEKRGLWRSSMVMLGDAVFCLCTSNSEITIAREVLTEYWLPSEVIITRISDRGGRILT